MVLENTKSNSPQTSAYIRKGVYKSLYVVSSKCLKHTQIATKYEKDILKIKLETAAISKEIVMTELEIAKQKLTTEQYIL